MARSREPSLLLIRENEQKAATVGGTGLTHDTHNDAKRGIFDVLGVWPLT
jgi:hypothetical protein